MNRWLACSLAGTIAAFSAFSLSIAGCGSSNNGSDAGTDTGTLDHHNPPPGDGGKDGKAPKDGGKDVVNPFDSPPSEGGGDAGDAGFMIPLEGGPAIPPGATQLVNTVDAGFQGVTVVGITEDDSHVIYIGFTATTAPVFAIPLAGGTPVKIMDDIGTSYYSPTIIHNTVFMFTGPAMPDAVTGNLVGALSIWTAKNGPQKNVSTATVQGAWAASPDSSMIAYVTNASADGQTGDLVAATSDLVTKHTLLSKTAANVTSTIATYFNPDIGFANDTYFVATHEESADGGLTPATISFWDTATWTKTDLVSPAAVTSGTSAPQLNSGPTWSTAMTGTGAGNTIVAATKAGTLEAFVLPSTTPTTIDTGVSSLYVKPDGSGVLYGTTGTPTNGYKLATLPTPSTLTTILASGFGGFSYYYAYYVQPSPVGVPFTSISKDGNWMLFEKNMTSVGQDINLVHNAAGASVASLLSSPSGSSFSDSFTADSTYALYITNITSNYTGNLNAYPVAGSKAVPITTNNGYNLNYLSGTKIIYNDNWVAPGIADISTVDVAASPLAPKSIIQAADQNFYITGDRVTLVFSMEQGNVKTDGLYTYKP